MNIGNLSVGIEFDKSKLTTGLNDVSRGTQQLGNKLSNLISTIGAALSFTAIIAGVKKTIEAYTQQEQAIIKLNSALKNQEIYSESLSQSFQAQALSLSKITTFSDEAITAGQALAMNMGVTANTVKQITPIVLDFAAAMGMDLESAFKVVGKAALGEHDMLKRYGVIISDDELKTEGFNAVLEKLQKNLGGTAEAMGKAGGGNLIQFKNQIGELQETIGQALLPILLKGTKTLSTWLDTFNKAFLITKDNTSATQQMIDKYKELEKRTRQQIQDLMDLGAAQGSVYYDLTKRLKSYTELRLKEEKKLASETIETETKKSNIIVELSKEEKEKINKIREKELEEKEKERKKELKDAEDSLEKKKDIIIKEYDLRRELRQLNLEQVVENLKEQYNAEVLGSERSQALFLALNQYQEALSIEKAAKIADVQNSINNNLQQNLVQMAMGEQNFADTLRGIWNSLHRTFIEMLIKELVEFKLAAMTKIIANKMVAISAAIAGYAGIPFIGPFLVAGAIAGILALFSQNIKSFQTGTQNVTERGLAMLHPGEAVIPREQNPYLGKNLTPAFSGSGAKNINFVINANVRSDEDWDKVVRNKIIPSLDRYRKKTYQSPFI